MTEHELRKIWATELPRFVAAFPAVAGVKLALRVRHYKLTKDERLPRDLAWYDPRCRTVCVMRDVLNRSAGAVRGILWHELGHAADTDIDRSGREARADRLAKRATGVPVRYTAEGLQHASHGHAGRPRWLHA